MKLFGKKKQKINPNAVHHETVKADPAIEAMDKAEALAYFKLPEWASKEDLDAEFWKLGKTYRAQKDEQKLADIALAYKIASGERDREEAEKKVEDQSKHYFGKTSKQWKEFWHYNWWIFVVAIAAILIITAFFEYFILDPKVDFRVASVGHFTQDTEVISSYLEDTFKFKNPDVQAADYVAENAEEEEMAPYAGQKAISIMSVKPDMLVYDILTAPIYVNSGDMVILDDIYEQMKATWTEEQLSHIEPYIYSKARFYEEYGESLPQEYKDDLEPLTDADRVDHVYGFIVRDKIDRLSLGYTVKWKEADPIIIFGLSTTSTQKEKATECMLSVLSNIKDFRAAYMEEHPYAEDTD